MVCHLKTEATDKFCWFFSLTLLKGWFFFSQLIFISCVCYLMLFQSVNLDMLSLLVLSAFGWINFVSNVVRIQKVGGLNLLLSQR